MPYSHDWEPRGVVKRFWGNLHSAEILQSVQEVVSHPDFDRMRYVLYDLREVQSIELRQEDLDHIAALRIGSLQSNPRIDILHVTVDPEHAALARPARDSVLHGTHRMHIFDSIEAARAWLNEHLGLGVTPAADSAA